MNFYYLFNKALVYFYLSYFHALYFVSTLTCIFCILHDFGVLGVARKIQVTSSLQTDDLFTSRFMGLGNPLKIVVHHILIGRMVGLGYQNGFPMVCTYVYGIFDRTYGES